MTSDTKATEQYFSVLLFSMLNKLTLTFYSVDKILSVTIQIRVLKNNFLWYFFVMLCKVALTFETVDKIPRCHQSSESY